MIKKFIFLILFFVLMAGCENTESSLLTTNGDPIQPSVKSLDETKPKGNNDVFIKWGTNNEIAQYHYYGGILTHASIKQSFKVENGSGIIKISVNFDEDTITEEFSVEKDKSYVINVVFVLTEGKTEPYKKKFIISSDSSTGLSEIIIEFDDYIAGQLTSISLEDPGATPTTQSLNGIACNGDLFIAVGGNGTILSSHDGYEWTVCVSSTDVWLEDVIWDGSHFIVVGGHKTILISDDGIRWDIVQGVSYSESNNDSNQLTGVAWNGELYVAVGYNGLILTSHDSKEWVEIEIDLSESLNAITSGNDIFFAVGDNRTIVFSENRIDWTQDNLTQGGWPEDICWNGDKYIIVGLGGTILVSLDGLEWNQIDTGIYQDLHGVASNGQSSVAVGDAGTILISDDGSNWRNYSKKSNDTYYDVVYNLNFLKIIPCII